MILILENKNKIIMFKKQKIIIISPPPIFNNGK